MLGYFDQNISEAVEKLEIKGRGRDAIAKKSPMFSQDKNRKSKLLSIFRELSNTALQPFLADLSWQNKLNSSISTVIDSAKSEPKGTTHGILTAIQTIHMVTLAADAISSVASLSNTFFSNLHEQLKAFREEKGFSGKVKQNELPASQIEMLKEF
ncbi:hypothetical protein SRHO_G00256440 [Serrasalmus rhombeus]